MITIIFLIVFFAVLKLVFKARSFTFHVNMAGKAYKTKPGYSAINLTKYDKMHTFVLWYFTARVITPIPGTEEEFKELFK